MEKLNKLLSEKECLHPNGNCSSGIIRSHTIQKSKALSKIAVDGHVYQMKFNNSEIISKRPVAIRPDLVGSNLATTYYGFCAKHDNELFRPIDNMGFSGEIRQCFLYSYRALCKEVYLRIRAIKSMPEYDTIKNFRSNLTLEEYQSLNSLFTTPHQITNKILSELKTKYDDMLKNEVFDDLKNYVILFDQIPTVLCNSIFFPAFDFQGRQIVNLEIDEEMHAITVNIFPTDSGGVALFSWLKKHHKGPYHLCKSLNKIPHRKKTASIIQMCFEFFENIAWSPPWWDALENDLKDSLINQFDHNLGLINPPRQNALVESDYLYDDWDVTEAKFL